MPSPFPGMDPYLENVIYWKGVHNSLVSVLSFALNNSLPEAFVARIEGRSYILPNHDLIYPDAILVRSPSEETDAPSSGIATTPSTTTSPLLFEYTMQEIEEPYVVILSVDSEEVVAIIEVLSPTNKAPEGTGREEYLRKQRDILRSQTHLLEIDLLRGGAHSVAIGREAVLSRTRYDYLVSLHRAGDERKSRFAVWAWSVRDPLPTIAVPLLPGWADAPLDLQAVWNDTYRGGRWDRTINYRHNPEPPLSPADAVWADALLREKGLRE
jgi:hypothetical protein